MGRIVQAVTRSPFSNSFKDLCVVTVYTCLKIYLYKKDCLFLSTMLHSLACFIVWLSNMLQIHGFVYT